jgi:hypothetical protein
LRGFQGWGVRPAWSWSGSGFRASSLESRDRGLGLVAGGFMLGVGQVQGSGLLVWSSGVRGSKILVWSIDPGQIMGSKQVMTGNMGFVAGGVPAWKS